MTQRTDACAGEEVLIAWGRGMAGEDGCTWHFVRGAHQGFGHCVNVHAECAIHRGRVHAATLPAIALSVTSMALPPSPQARPLLVKEVEVVLKCPALCADTFCDLWIAEARAHGFSNQMGITLDAPGALLV